MDIGEVVGIKVWFKWVYEGRREEEIEIENINNFFKKFCCGGKERNEIINGR